MKKLFFFLLLSLSVSIAKSQVNGDYRSTGTVSLTSATNWESYTGGAWTAATTAPNAATLSAGNTITILPTHTWNNTIAATVPEGVTLLFQGAAGTFAANLLTINGTYIHATAANASTVFTGVSTSTGIGPNSTIIYRASASYATPSAALGGRTFNNLYFDTDGTTVTQPSFSSPGFTSPVNVNGTMIVDTWKADFYTSGNSTALNFNGDVTLAGASSYLRVRTFTLNTGKTLTINSTDSLGVGQGFAVTLNGTLLNKSLKPIAFGTGSTLVVNGTYQLDANGGSIPNSNTTYSPTSTIAVTGLTNVSNLPVLPTSCGNVLWNCPAQTNSNTFVNTNSNTTTVNGNLTVQSTGTGYIYLGGAGTGRTLTVTGNLIVNGGKLGVIRAATNATANQVANVSGDVIISSGEFLVADIIAGATNYTGKGYLNVTGSINHTGGNFGSGATAADGTGVITFTGNNFDKTINSIGLIGKSAIVIDKTATGLITLASNLSLAAGSSIGFTSGKLAINAGSILEVPNMASITGASATSYIASNVSGASLGMVKSTAITGAAVFPVGTANAYLPVTLNPATSSDFTVGVFEGLTTNGTPNGTALSASQLAKVVNAGWIINRTSANTDDCTVTVNWPTTLEGSSFNALGNNIGLGRFNGSTWQAFGGTGDNTANTATNTFSSFSPFAVGELATTLPVKMVDVSAAFANGKVSVNWRVQNEVAVDKYIVERSRNGLQFEELTIVNARNSSTANYNCSDVNPFAGANYYRIKSIDKTGTAIYSAVVKINTSDKTSNQVKIYPNVIVDKTIHLQLNGMDSDVYAISIVNSAGQEVFAKSLGNISGNATMTFALQQNTLPGTYRVLVKGSKQQLVQTIIIP